MTLIMRAIIKILLELFPYLTQSHLKIFIEIEIVTVIAQIGILCNSDKNIISNSAFDCVSIGDVIDDKPVNFILSK